MSEIYQKSDCFAAFAGASAKYLGEREGVLAKKSRDEWQKERFTMHASLCGGGDLLKALESVAFYLADRLLNMSNDTHPGNQLFVTHGIKWSDALAKIWFLFGTLSLIGCELL